jgi:hypothetical protein
MAEIDKAIDLAQRLRSLIIKIVASEKDEAEYEASDDNMLDTIGTFNEAANADEVPAVDLLAQIDQILYNLMSYSGGGDRWIDADQVDSKEMFSLKEIVAEDDFFKLKEIFLASAA